MKKIVDSVGGPGRQLGGPDPPGPIAGYGSEFSRFSLLLFPRCPLPLSLSGAQAVPAIGYDCKPAMLTMERNACVADHSSGRQAIETHTRQQTGKQTSKFV